MCSHATMKAVLGLVSLLLLWTPALAMTVSSDALWHMVKSWTGASSTSDGRVSSTPPQAGWALYDKASKTFHYAPAGSGVTGINRPAPAYASYSHYNNHQSGFGQLRVKTDPAFSNGVQMQAAGFIEGYLTAPQIFDHWYNQRWWLSQKTNDTYKVMDWCGTSYTGSCCIAHTPRHVPGI
eukprot:GHUV01040182.1.p1 GENE.GHUV01040182.1~~GHUV01040182.1.p1  ORF type:complete len:180 (+),score=42.92 GHUV01040182.1:239-778(+)